MNDTVSTGFGLVKQEVHPQLSQIITLNAINLLVNKFGDQHVEDAVNCRETDTRQAVTEAAGAGQYYESLPQFPLVPVVVYP